MSQRWVIGIVVVVVVVLGGVGLAFALGGDDGNEQASNTTTTSTTSTTTVTPPSSGSTSVTIGIVCTTPEDAAESIVSAWIAGDEAAAGRCAAGAVVTELFTTSGTGADYSFQGCFGDPGVPDCAFTYEGGSVHFTMNGTEAEGWKAVSIGYVAD